jgi:hypothetical protein
MVTSVEAETRVVPRRHIKCRLPCLRLKRFTKGFSSDTFFPSVKSVRGYNCVQVFVGTRSGYTFVVPLKNKAYAHTALQDFIRYVGAPLFISVDAAREENTGEWLSVCRTFCIPQRTSEPTYQNQNRVERRIQDIKRRTTVLMSMHGAPSRYWDYAVENAVELINHTAVRKLNWRTPQEVLMGETPGISVFRFTFYEPIHYHNPNNQFPKLNMLPGRFLGISQTTGDAFTFVITTDDGNWPTMLHRSVIRKRTAGNMDPYSEDIIESDGVGSTSTENHQLSEGRTANNIMAESYLSQDLDSQEETVISSIPNRQGEEDMDNVSHSGKEGYTEENTGEIYNHFDQELRCEDILAIVGSEFDENNGKLYLQVEWRDGGESSIDAELLQQDDPFQLAKYLKENPAERLRSGFWSQWADRTLHSISNTTRRLRQMYYEKGARNSTYPYSRRVLQHKKTFPMKMQTYMGIEIPRNTKEALYLDKKNKDGLWKGAIKKEIDGIRGHGTFLFLPPGAKPPEGYQEAPLRMIYDIKPDLRRKGRLVVGGHMVNAEGYTCYSSVVRIDSIRMLNVIAKAQGLDVLAGDVGNAYLNADTKEKVYVRCGPEFGPELEGRIAIIKKSLYGLKSSGAQWHAHFAKTLYMMGFQPTRFDNGVWIKERIDGSGYDYISTYVDDFLITAKDP